MKTIEETLAEIERCIQVAERKATEYALKNANRRWWQSRDENAEMLCLVFRSHVTMLSVLKQWILEL